MYLPAHFQSGMTLLSQTTMSSQSIRLAKIGCRSTSPRVTITAVTSVFSSTAHHQPGGTAIAGEERRCPALDLFDLVVSRDGDREHLRGDLRPEVEEVHDLFPGITEERIDADHVPHSTI